MKRLLAILFVALAVPLVAFVIYLAVLFWNGTRGEFPPEGAPVAARRPSARAVGERGESPQILFGDLHVHTVYSADAHLQSVRIRDRVRANPPADACDFARYCSELDFWSINDHAESLSPDLWRRTVEAVRECNASAGDPSDPDLVSFLGWEWSHQGRTPEEHYGHKNVILLDTEEGRIPTRPIASVAGPPARFLGMSLLAPIVRGSLARWADFHRYALDVLAVRDCPEGVPVRDLPNDCRESAPDPRSLFAKLDEWGFPALVIPHGLAWGVTNPAHSDLVFQIGQHDPRWQRLVEVYSGHGNSEIYRDFEWPRKDADGAWSCPTGGDDFEPCCARAAALVRDRCESPESPECASEMADARRRASRTFGGLLSPTRAVEGSDAAEFGECNQLRNSFLPSFGYRPRHSAQYGYALGGDAEGRATETRYRMGMIGSSDTHRSRPGTGYREFRREIMTDGVSYPMPEGFFDARNVSYYYTGGLAAVHAGARDRESIFDALHRREVYATSGDRILLWFDLLDSAHAKHPMGSEVELAETPRFEVRAVGDWKQRPGCPDFVGQALSEARIADLCQGACYHPSDERKRIVRIEVVRIRPQADPDEAIASRIEDPWRSFVCPPSPDGCRIVFDDPDFVSDGRETVYYVRALQEATLAVNGDPLRCERDADGSCVRARPCGVGADGLPEDCLAAVEERAWSSPIFVDFASF